MSWLMSAWSQERRLSAWILSLVDKKDLLIQKDGEIIELLPNNPTVKARLLRHMQERRLVNISKLLTLCTEDLQKTDAQKVTEQKLVAINILAQTDYILQLQAATAAKPLLACSKFKEDKPPSPRGLTMHLHPEPPPNCDLSSISNRLTMASSHTCQC